VDVLRQYAPHALDLLEKGEGLGAGGQLEAAHETFVLAEKEVASNSLVWRRDCEALTAMGRREEAVRACILAAENGRYPVNTRAMVRALMGGPVGPSPSSLFQALAVVTAERRNSTGMIGPSFMMCDIAESLGDINMLKRSADEVERLAPFDPETRRARALLASHCPPARFWLGWAAIVAAVLVTAWDALRRVRVGVKRKWLTASVAAGAVALFALPARAADAPPPDEAPKGGWLTHLPIDDEHPENTVPTEDQKNKDPLDFGYWIQDITLKAERASQKGRHEASARYYLALARAVPDRAVAFRKMCEQYEAAGKRDEAINACGDALMRDGVEVRDYTHFVQLLLAKPTALNDKEVAAVGHVLKHMKDDPTGAPFADELECEAALRTLNVTWLKECTAGLASRQPYAPSTIKYELALAVQESRFGDARKLLQQAQSMGIPVDRMEKAVRADERRHRIYQGAWIALGSALVAVALLLAGRTMRRRRTLAASA
jgi:tetratricopeptide (TPR) repeat protein